MNSQILNSLWLVACSAVKCLGDESGFNKYHDCRAIRRKANGFFHLEKDNVRRLRICIDGFTQVTLSHSTRHISLNSQTHSLHGDRAAESLCRESVEPNLLPRDAFNVSTHTANGLVIAVRYLSHQHLSHQRFGGAKNLEERKWCKFRQGGNDQARRRDASSSSRR